MDNWTVKEGTVFTVTIGGTSEASVLATEGESAAFVYGDPDKLTLTAFALDKDIGGGYTAKVGTFNLTTPVSVINLIVAGYDSSGRLVNAVIQENSVIQGEYKEWSVSLPANSRVSLVKAFIWDANMIPLIEALSR
jgi:hypothetical protein